MIGFMWVPVHESISVRIIFSKKYAIDVWIMKTSFFILKFGEQTDRQTKKQDSEIHLLFFAKCKKFIENTYLNSTFAIFKT